MPETSQIKKRMDVISSKTAGKVNHLDGDNIEHRDGGSSIAMGAFTSRSFDFLYVGSRRR